MSTRKLRDYTKYQYNRYAEILELGNWPMDQDSVDVFLYNANNNVARSFLRTFIKFLIARRAQFKFDDDFIGQLNLLDIPKNKQKTVKEKKVITVNQVKTLFDKVQDPLKVLMLKLSYYCGLRASEVRAVKAGDINITEYLNEADVTGTLTIPDGKGGKPAVRNIPEALMEELCVRYSELHPDVILFNISEWSWWDAVKRMGQKYLGINTLSPHVLRRSIATHLIENDVDIRIVQEFLRHEDISTTQIYAQVSKKKVDKVVGKFVDKNFI